MLDFKHTGAVLTVAGFILATGCSGSRGASGGVGTNVLPQTPALAPISAPRETLSRNARETVLYAFKGGKDGSQPYAVLIHINGALYGTTLTGGGSTQCSISGGTGCGTVFELVPSGSGYTESVLHRFKGGKDGAGPQPGLTQGSGGALFGTTEGGGKSGCAYNYRPAGCGTVFALTPSASGYTKSTLYAFKGGSDGAIPWSGLLVKSSGVLYGTTTFGGNPVCSIPAGSGCGTVFELTPSGQSYVKTAVYQFAGGGVSDGAHPYGALIAVGGTFYGTTAYGGNTGCGIGCGSIFELKRTKSGFSENILYRFKGGKDGQWPKAGLIADASGALYGTTEGGGGTSCTNYNNLNGCGTVFKLIPSQGKYSLKIIYRFQDTNDGAWPYSGLNADASGTLYGAAFLGGSGACYVAPLNGQCGTVFKLTGSGTTYAESTLYAFKGGADGALPFAGPILVKGLLYGMTSSGGKCSSHGCGTVYKVKP